MAFATRNFLFFFFTSLVLLSAQIHARDSYFFGKFHRETSKDESNPNNVIPLETSERTSVEESIPNKKEQEQEPTFLPESEGGYGLYGHETTYNNKEEFDNNNNKFDENVNVETFSTPSLSDTEKSYNNYDEKYHKKTKSYNDNGYNNEEFNNNNKYDDNVKEDSFSNNNEDKRSIYNSNAYGMELERETPYKGYSHNLERQGMSDTRFMEKGNYYYDLYNDRNHGHFYRKPHRKSSTGYYSSPATENNYDQSYSYGNNNHNNNNKEEEVGSFNDQYKSKWEKNMMNEQPEEFVEEQGDQFKP